MKEFYDQMVELVLAVRTPTELAREFEPTANAIRGWVKQAAVDAGESPEGLTSSERDEMRELRREGRNSCWTRLIWRCRSASQPM